MRKVSMQIYVKGSNGKYNTYFYINGNRHDCYGTEDINEVHEKLMLDLIAKKLHKCTYITRITDRCNYDGTRTIEVYYDNKTKCAYVVEA